MGKVTVLLFLIKLIINFLNLENFQKIFSTLGGILGFEPTTFDSHDQSVLTSAIQASFAVKKQQQI